MALGGQPRSFDSRRSDQVALTTTAQRTPSMSFFKRIFGGETRPTEAPPCPPIEQVEAYVRWTLRYGPEFEAIRCAFFTERPDSFVEVSVKHLSSELDALADMMPLYERYEKVSRFYETELLPIVRKCGGVRSCPKEVKFTAIEVYVRVIVMNRFLRALDALAPPLTYESVTPLPV